MAPEPFQSLENPRPAAAARGRARWLQIEKPAARGAAVRAHLPWVLLLAPVFLIVGLLPIVGELPVTICTFRNLTGYPCLTCGFTRAFVALAHGHWRATLGQCPAALPLFLGLAAVLAWHAGGLLTGRVLRVGPALTPTRRGWWVLIAGGAALLLANWIYRLSAGLK